MPSSRAPLVKSLDVRRRTLAPHSGEAAMVPDFSGRHDQPASQLSALELGVDCLSLSPWAGRALSACLPLSLFTSHISLLAILPSNSPPILHFNSTRHHPQNLSLTIHQYFISHFISHPPATRACDLRSYALLPFALACCTFACIYATGRPLLLFHPSASPSPTRALAVRLHFHTHVQLRG